MSIKMSLKRKNEFKICETVLKKKHTLDSDEEDSDEYEKVDLNTSDVVGEEDGVAKTQDDITFTPFNMREELDEGHFDTDGHYHWNKNSEIKDNWLENIDWIKIKEQKEQSPKEEDKLAEDKFDQLDKYRMILEYMKENETIQKTLQRLGKNRKKISSAQRLQMRKNGIVDESEQQITQLTGLINDILIHTGNMNIYEESYYEIKKKVCSTVKSNASDMFSDNFEENRSESVPTSSQIQNKIKWEIKLDLLSDDIRGPYSTQEMIEMVNNKFNDGKLYVRKVGDESVFYSIARIDFDLYL